MTKPVFIDRPFKKRGRYRNLDEAKEGLTGTPEQVEKLARGRLNAQKVRDKVRSENLQEEDYGQKP